MSSVDSNGHTNIDVTLICSVNIADVRTRQQYSHGQVDVDVLLVCDMKTGDDINEEKGGEEEQEGFLDSFGA